MKAVKANKVYEITEAEKKGYIDQGFDIVDANGEVIAYGRGKTVPYDTYAKVVKELETLRNKMKKLEKSAKEEAEKEKK